MLSDRYSRWTWVAAAAVCVAGIAVSIASAQLWPLDLVVLGTHELGHLFSGGLSDPAQAFAGTVGQILIPVLLIAIGAFSRRWLLVPLGLLWLGYSAENVSLYVADAPTGQLDLVGFSDDPIHDWEFLLSPEAWGGLSQATEIAAKISLGAKICAGGALGLCLWFVARPPRLHRSSHLGSQSGGGLRGLGEQLRKDKRYSDDDDYGEDFAPTRGKGRWKV